MKNLRNIFIHNIQDKRYNKRTNNIVIIDINFKWKTLLHHIYVHTCICTCVYICNRHLHRSINNDITLPFIIIKRLESSTLQISKPPGTFFPPKQNIGMKILLVCLIYFNFVDLYGRKVMIS